jgi:iron(III) transport system permease protein
MSVLATGPRRPKRPKGPGTPGDPPDASAGTGRRIGALDRLFVPGLYVLGAVVALLVVVPLVWMFVKLLLPHGHLDTAAFADVWHQGGLGQTLLNTVLAVGGGTVGALVTGTVFAWLNERTNARIGWLSEALPVIPLFMPQLAISIGWILLGSQGPGFLNAGLRWAEQRVGMDPGAQGPLNVFSWYGLIFLYILTLVPQVYLVVAAALRNVDPALEEASRANGAGVLRTLWKVTVPGIRPALVSAAMLALVAGFALFSVPVTIGTSARINILSVRIVDLVTAQYPPRLDEALVLSIVMMIGIGSAFVVQRKVTALARHSAMGGKSAGTAAVDLGSWQWVARVAMLVYLVATVLLPLLGLFVVSLQKWWVPRIDVHTMSFHNYATLFSGTSETSHALWNSLRLGVITATLAMLLACALAYLVARRPASVTGRIVEAVTKLPGVVSQMVVAVGLIAVFAGKPFNLHGTSALLVLGYLIVFLPQATIAASSAITQVGPSLLEASHLSGAGEGRTFFRVVAPLMRPGIVSGWVLVFVLSAGDLTASVMLAGASTPVVGFVMLDLTNSGTYGVLAAMGVVVTLVMSAISVTMLMVGRRQNLRRSR